MAKTKGSDTSIPAHWYDDLPSPEWDAEWLRRRTAELGPGFEALVSSVMSCLGCPSGKRDQVRPWLISCIDQYKSNKNVGPAVRKWLDDLATNAAALLEVLDRGPPFLPGSAQADFPFHYKDDGGRLLELPGDTTDLRKMAKGAKVLASAYRKVGAPARHDRDVLISRIEDGFGVFASKRATTEAVCKVVCEMLAFIGEPRAAETVTRRVKRLRRIRRQLG